MKVVIRADASTSIGSGHVMRCLTLAEALRMRSADVSFITRACAGHLIDMVRARGFAVTALAPESAAERDAEETIAALQGRRPEWLVVDHYGLDERWESRLGAHAGCLMAVDDLADRRHECDALLDQNVYPDQPARYAGKLPPGCTCWFGPTFLLLREEFRREMPCKRREAPVGRVLVTFGGSDPGNTTARAIAALAGAHRQGIAVDVVIGTRHPHLQALREACARHGYECHFQTDRMAKLMARADLALCAAGFTALEAAAMALPAILVPATLAQERLALELTRLGAARMAPADEGRLREEWLRLSGDAAGRMAMSKAAAGLTDGNGAGRVAEAMMRIAERASRSCA